VTESICGVGNPCSLGEPLSSQTVLDLGCGVGFDTLLAFERVGPNGEVIGVDMTHEMIAASRRARRFRVVLQDHRKWSRRSESTSYWRLTLVVSPCAASRVLTNAQSVRETPVETTGATRK